jgi:hypothetical protein
MKKNSLLVITLLIYGVLFSVVNAQNDILNIFKAGVMDLNTVANGYLKPAGNSFSAGLGSDWYNTAAVHKPFGFDLTLGVGVVSAPNSDQTFGIGGLTVLKPTDASLTTAPTFSGKGNGVELNLFQPQYLSNNQPNPFYHQKIVSFYTPSGVSNYVPTASVQFTIGIPFINDISFRFVPKVSFKGFDASLWGIGIKHNFKQWIPVIKDLPFDAAIVLAYTKFELKYAFPVSAQITPDQLVSDCITTAPDPNTTYSDYTTQGMKISANAQTVNLVFSKKLLFITPYLGFGFTNTSFDLSMTGNYPTLGDPVSDNVGGVLVPRLNENGKPILQIINKPNLVNISSNQVLTNATMGLRIKLAVLTIHAQYAFQKYPVASAGFGFSFR